MVFLARSKHDKLESELERLKETNRSLEKKQMLKKKIAAEKRKLREKKPKTRQKKKTGGIVNFMGKVGDVNDRLMVGLVGEEPRRRRR